MHHCIELSLFYLFTNYKLFPNFISMFRLVWLKWGLLAKNSCFVKLGFDSFNIKPTLCFISVIWQTNLTIEFGHTICYTICYRILNAILYYWGISLKWKMQGNEIWGLGNGYYSSKSERVMQSPKPLVGHQPFYSKVDRALLGAPARVR